MSICFRGKGGFTKFVSIFIVLTFFLTNITFADISPKIYQNLQPQLLIFDSSQENSSFEPFFAEYFSLSLTKYIIESGVRHPVQLLDFLNEEIKRYEEAKKIPENFLDVAVKEGSIYIYQDEGTYVTRLYNPESSKELPDSREFQLVDSGKIGKYFAWTRYKGLTEEEKKERDRRDQANDVSGQGIHAVDVLGNAFAGATILPSFSTLAADTTDPSGSDLNRRAALDIFRKNGIYANVPEGMEKDQKHLDYEYLEVPIIIPKEVIPEELKDADNGNVVEKLQEFLGATFSEGKVRIIEKQMRSYMLKSEEVGPFAFDLKSAIARVTDQGNILVQIHFWVKRDFAGVEGINAYINEKYAKQVFEKKDFVSLQKLAEGEDALEYLSNNAWEAMRQVLNGKKRSVKGMISAISSLQPETLLDTENIAFNKDLKTFYSTDPADENGYGAHLRDFLASLNEMEELVAYLYVYSFPQFDKTAQAGVAIESVELPERVLAFYHRLWTYLYRLGEEEFGDPAVFEPMRMVIGEYATAINRSMRIKEAIEVNQSSSSQIADQVDKYGFQLSDGEKQALKIIDEMKKSGEFKGFYDIMQLAVIFSETSFINAFKYLKVEDVPEVEPSARPYEIFDGTGRICNLGFALSLRSDLRSKETRENRYYPKYMMRTRSLKDKKGKLSKFEKAQKLVENMANDDVIETSEIRLPVEGSSPVEMSKLFKGGQLTFKATGEVLEAKQDYKVNVPIKCVYPVKILLKGKDIGTVYVVDSSDFTEGMMEKKIQQDNIPRPCILTENGKDEYFGFLTDVTPGGVWIGDGFMEMIVDPGDYSKMTAWQLAGTHILPESATGTMNRLAELLEQIPGTQEIVDILKSDRSLYEKIDLLRPRVKEVKAFYKQHPDLTEKKVKEKIMGGASKELRRLREFLKDIEANRLVEGDNQKFIYLKAQISKKLLLPLSGGIHFFGKNHFKSPNYDVAGARFLTPTSCSTNGATYITQALLYILGGFGKSSVAEVGTTLHQYTSGDAGVDKDSPTGEKVYGHLNPKSTGAAKGVLQHKGSRRDASVKVGDKIFTAVRTPTAAVDGVVQIVGGSIFDLLVEFNDPVDEDDLRKYLERMSAQFPGMIRMFDPKDVDDNGAYAWKDTISGKRTGSILFLDYIERVGPNQFRLFVAYDNEMSYSYKMKRLVDTLFLSIEREKAIRKLSESLGKTRSANKYHMRRGKNANKPLSIEEEQALNLAIKATIEEQKERNIHQERSDILGKLTFVLLEDEIYEKYAKKYNAPLDVDCMPGTNGTRYLYNEGRHEETFPLVDRRIYIKRSLFEQATFHELQVIGYHEAAHLMFSLKHDLADIPEGQTEEEFINTSITKEHDIRPVAAKYDAYLNAKETIPAFVNGLMLALSKLPKDKQLLLALDTDIGSGITNEEVKELYRYIEHLKENNADIKELLKKLEIVTGKTDALAKSLNSVTNKGNIDPENIILITKAENSKISNAFSSQAYFSKATVTAIDDSMFPEKAYLPLAPIALLSVGKYLGWSDEKLYDTYKNIPNVLEVEEGSETYKKLFEGDNKKLVIYLIPDATEMNKEELKELWKSMQQMFRSA